MKVHVDQDVCQGHGAATPRPRRCSNPTTSATASSAATAPCPRARGRRPAWRSPTARRERSRIEESTVTPTTDSRPIGSATATWAQGITNEIIEGPVGRLGHRLRPRRRGVGRRPVPDLRDLRRALPDRPHRPLRRRAGCRPATRTSRRSPTTPSASPRASVVMGNHRPPLELAPVGRRAADLVGPAVPPRRPPAAAARLRAEGHRQARAGDPRATATSCSTRSRAATWSTPPSSTRSTSRCG